MMESDRAWESLKASVTELRDLRAVGGLLHWDENVWMPAGGAAARGRQKSVVARLRHQLLVDPKLGEALAAVGQSQDPQRQAAARNLGRVRDRAVKTPASLVSERALASSEAFAAWRQARASDDAALFAGPLARMVELARHESACIGVGVHPYDALLDGYDPGLTLERVQALFRPLERGLVALLDGIRGAAPIAAAPVAMSTADQRRVFLRVLPALGFDLGRGRLDTAPHPFCMGMDPGDVRLTTRYDEADLMSGLLGTIHEGGHGMYEQGLPGHLRGSTVDEAASTAMHEANSRLWENRVGRSPQFLGWLAGVVAEETGIRLDLPALVASCNRVEAGFIRVEADEVTYNLHILLRTRIEAALLTGELSVDELPGAWEEQSLALLGVRPPRPSLGHLQDVHWSQGLFGYFPSYTLGNLYAASLFRRLEEDRPTVWECVAVGDFSPVLGFLREHIHSVGHLYDGEELLARVAPGRDPVGDLLDSLRARQGALYGVVQAGRASGG
mgnify:CR=1 FL=1